MGLICLIVNCRGDCYSFGQDAIDIAVNGYAAKRFSSDLMSILYDMYGVGVTLSSYVMA